MFSLFFGLFYMIYLRCPVLIVPYPLFDHPHQRSYVVELCFFKNAWHKNKSVIKRLQMPFCTMFAEMYVQ